VTNAQAEFADDYVIKPRHLREVVARMRRPTPLAGG
jgi:DNA-binding response OmpR family regulator